MKVSVNNKPVETEAQNLSQLIAQLQLSEISVAIGVNNRMVPRTAWTDYALTDGLNIVIIKAACGG